MVHGEIEQVVGVRIDVVPQGGLNDSRGLYEAVNIAWEFSEAVQQCPVQFLIDCFGNSGERDGWGLLTLNVHGRLAMEAWVEIGVEEGGVYHTCHSEKEWEMQTEAEDQTTEQKHKNSGKTAAADVNNGKLKF